MILLHMGFNNNKGKEINEQNSKFGRGQKYVL